MFNKKTVLKDNIEAIKMAFFISKSGKKLEGSDLEIVKKYKGFGGLKCILQPISDDWGSEENLKESVKELHEIIRINAGNNYDAYISSLKASVLTAFYTPEEVIQGIGNVIFDSVGKIDSFLDPSSGIGAFKDALNTSGLSLLNTVEIEKDIVSNLFNNVLSQKGIGESETFLGGFEEYGKKHSNRFDLVASNIPFGDFPIYDPEFFSLKNRKDPKYLSCSRIHNYFFVKALDKTREGGIIAFITTDATMNTESNKFLREYLVQKSNLVSCIRFSHDLFNEAGTAAGSDLIILQKNDNKQGQRTSAEMDFIAAGEYNGFPNNNYFLKNKENIVSTESKESTNQYGKPALIYSFNGDKIELKSRIESILRKDFANKFDKNLYHKNQYKSNIEEENEIKIKDKLNHTLDLFGSYEYIEPVKYKGAILPHYKDGTLVDVEGTISKLIKTDSGFLSKNIEFNTLNIQKLRSIIEVRDSYYNLQKYESDLQLENTEERKKLNQAYDNFKNKYGAISERLNLLLINNDVHRHDIIHLEKHENGLAVKSDIFNNPVSFKIAALESLNLEDAISSSLNKFGRIDREYIANTTGIRVENFSKEVEGKLYFNPDSINYETKEYLMAGDLYSKLNKFQAIYQSEEVDPGLKVEIAKTIDFVKSVLPEKIPIELIDIGLGSRWVPVEAFEDFYSHLFEDKVKIHYFKGTDEYKLSFSNNFKRNLISENEYAVKTESRRYDGLQIGAMALMDTSPVVTKTTVDEEGNEKRVEDTEAIQNIRSKIEIIKNKFSDFLIRYEGRKYLEDLYNEKFNCYTTVNYNGTHLKLEDLNRKNLGISDLYDSQKNAIWMLLQNQGGIVDHEVGGGKTLIMCVTAHEMKRLGIAEKPIITCLKANVLDIANTYKKAYPNDKVLFPSAKDLDSNNRQKFWAQIKNNDYDVIIMTHDQFLAIPQDLEVRKSVYTQELKDVEKDLDSFLKNLGGSSYANKDLLKGLEKRKESLKVKLAKLDSSVTGKKDDNVTFKEMGIDMILVDESHKFKNLMFTTRHNRVAGLGNLNGSERAANMLFAIRTIQNRRKRDSGAVFLSGTPISNSITELYSIFKYLKPRDMFHKNILNFDGWASVFTKKSVDFEISVANKMVQKERFRTFVNVPELASFYSQIADVQTAQSIGVDRPDMDVKLLALEPTEQQEDFVKRLMIFADTGDAALIDRAPLTENEEMAKGLIITNIGKKMALDMRLINSEKYDDSPFTKLSICAMNINRHYLETNEHKGTQLVFCDIGVPGGSNDFVIYDELKRKLIEDYGIPKHEIRFAQECTNDKIKAKMHADVNKGIVRIFIGSTETMGTGTNVQERIVAMHHLDIPWKPSDYDQRNGRGQRTGNYIAKKYYNNTVHSYVYATKNTLDNYKFNLLDLKSTFINQIKTNSTSQRVVDEGAMDEHSGVSMKDLFAIMLGNNDMLEKSKLEKKTRLLETEKMLFYKDVNNSKNSVLALSEKINKGEKIITSLEKDLFTFQSNLENSKDSDGNLKIQYLFNNKSFNDSKSLGKEVIEFEKNKLEGRKIIGEVLGFKVTVENRSIPKDIGVAGLFEYEDQKCYTLNRSDESGIYYTHNNGFINSIIPETAGSNFVKALNKIETLYYSEGKNLKDLKERYEFHKTMELKVWPKTEELSSLNEKIKELDKRIQITINEKSANMIKDYVATPATKTELNIESDPEAKKKSGLRKKL